MILKQNQNQNIPTELFAIGMQMGLSDLKVLFTHIDEVLLSREILGFDKNV
jgi:hypothetical protein